MSYTPFRGPTDDWDTQGYEDETTENLAALGMHTTGTDDTDDDEDEDKAGVKAAPASASTDEEEEEIDELKALDRLEKELKDTELDLPNLNADEEDGA